MNLKEIPETIEMEKQLFSDMFMKERLVVPDVAAIIDSDDLYRVEHRLVFQAILRLYVKGEPIDYLAVEEELRKSGDFGKIDHRYFLFLIDATFPLLALSITLISLKKKPTCASLSNLATCSKTRLNTAKNLSTKLSLTPKVIFPAGVAPLCLLNLRNSLIISPTILKLTSTL